MFIEPLAPKMKDLTELGFTDYENKAYVALLKKGPLDSRKLSKATKIPYTKIYTTLNSLLRKGFIEKSRTRPAVYSPLEPDCAVDTYMDRHLDELKKAKERVTRDLLKIRYKYEPTPPEKVIVVTGPNAQWKLMEAMYHNASSYVKEISPYDLGYDSSIAIGSAAARNVEIMRVTTKLDEATKKRIQAHQRLNASVRYYPAEEISLCIRDGDEAWQSVVSPHNPGEMMLMHLRDRDFIAALDDYFDTIWRKAENI